MKNPINPAVAAVIVIVVVVVAVILGWKSLGPRTDGPDKPINMAEKMGKMAPPPEAKGGAGRPGMAPGGH